MATELNSFMIRIIYFGGLPLLLQKIPDTKERARTDYCSTFPVRYHLSATA